MDDRGERMRNLEKEEACDGMWSGVREEERGVDAVDAVRKKKKREK